MFSRDEIKQEEDFEQGFGDQPDDNWDDLVSDEDQDIASEEVNEAGERNRAKRIEIEKANAAREQKKRLEDFDREAALASQKEEEELNRILLAAVPKEFASSISQRIYRAEPEDIGEHVNLVEQIIDDLKEDKRLSPSAIESFNNLIATSCNQETLFNDINYAKLYVEVKLYVELTKKLLNTISIMTPETGYPFFSRAEWKEEKETILDLLSKGIEKVAKQNLLEAKEFADSALAIVDHILDGSNRKLSEKARARFSKYKQCILECSINLEEMHQTQKEMEDIEQIIAGYSGMR